MFGKILVANRGEIALRVIRACKELGIETVAVYSEVDQDALHVRYADEAVCVGPASPSKSYLNIINLISTATLTGVDAIHPGYGFLSENPRFVEICETHNIKFIGPPASVMEKMGDKSRAKRIMKEQGVPVIPGSDGPLTSVEEALDVAAEIGYPVIIKAAAGGGGRGMRVVHSPDDLKQAVQTAQLEAEAAFGHPEVYLEKYLEEPRHIEIQVLFDEYGNGVYLGERECSLQRRHQKILEESPSPRVSPKLRKALGEAALKGARAVGYKNAGTVEFLVDKDDRFYFMEMNTRIQVEHPVTEMVTGIDLVKQQILIAAGEKLPWRQEEITLRGHAIECRINAEDPQKNFLPQPGLIQFYHAPGGPGIRVDSAAYSGYLITPYYDSMIAKLIAWGETREEAITRMIRALDEFEVEGIPSTILFHLEILHHPNFIKGEFTTDFVHNLIKELQLE
ncbi:MAG: acetyl-CoA carboxylase biotin carboxylase subunit [Firmicutes bacterium]|nr:acetyl-CoA carboxylase biotin carboxylase subunit [Bacillota bacterium]